MRFLLPIKSWPLFQRLLSRRFGYFFPFADFRPLPRSPSLVRGMNLFVVKLCSIVCFQRGFIGRHVSGDGRDVGGRGKTEIDTTDQVNMLSAGISFMILMQTNIL